MAVLMAVMGHGVGVARLTCPHPHGARSASEAPRPEPAHHADPSGHHTEPGRTGEHQDSRGPCSCPADASCSPIALPALRSAAVQWLTAAPAAPHVTFVMTSVARVRAVGTHPPATAPPALL